MEGLLFFLVLLLIFFYLFDVRPRLKSMEERLARLERNPTGSLPREPVSAEPTSATGPPPPPIAERRNPPPNSPQSAPKEARMTDLEGLIGGRWLNYIGIVALIFAAAFFLKHAFDNAWIGERTQILTGIACGGALLVCSHKLGSSGYGFFSEGIAGLGAAILFLSVYAGWGFYRLFPQSIAFIGMVAVCGLTVWLAVRRDSERISMLALFGGFLTPMLLSTGVGRHVILFGYLTVLNTSLLALAWARGWRSLDVLAFLGTQFLFWSWYNQFYGASKLGSTFIFASIFFIQFAALPAIRALKKESPTAAGTALILANAFWFLTALHGMLWPQYRWTLAAVLAVIAAAHLTAGQALRSAELKSPSTTSLVYGGLGLTFATLIIAVLLQGHWMVIAFAIEGTALVWSGFYSNLRLLRGAGLSLFGLVAFRLVAYPMASGPFLWNARFAAFSVAVVCFALSIGLARGRKDVLDDFEQILFAAVGIGVNVFAIWALSLEFWDLFGKPEMRYSIYRDFARQLALSLLWTSYAITLALIGAQRKIGSLRWQALGLFGIVVVKVFLYDLSFLRQFYRILSFVVLGLALLITSFLYHRRPPANRPTAER